MRLNAIETLSWPRFISDDGDYSASFTSSLKRKSSADAN